MVSRGTFGAWDESIHMPEDQQKRIKSAEKADTTPLSVDKEAQTGIFPGSGKKPYEVTLDSCTCGDFIRRKLPCKHMYRLAMECGVFDGKTKIGVNKNTLKSMQLSLEDVVSALESLPEQSQRKLQEMLGDHIFHKRNLFFIPDKYAEDLVGSSLFEPAQGSDEELLQTMAKNELLSILKKSGLEGYRENMRVATLRKWCQDNISDLWSVLPKDRMVSFSQKIQGSRRKLYTYLLRKYEWEEVFGETGFIQVPHGAKSEDATISMSLDGVSISGDPNTYWFPNDEVTQLLTKYGHNRCLNGYHAEGTKIKL